MANLTLNYELLRSVLGPQVADEIQKMQDSLNLLAKQTNGNPVGDVEPPLQVNAVTAISLGEGHADVAILDNNPVTRGVNYFVEYSTTPSFDSTSTKTIPLGPSRNARILIGSGPVYVRAYSGYPTSPPSDPVYHGGGTGVAINAGGTFVATAGNPGVGSGTERSTDPQPGAGFGFDPDRGRSRGGLL